MGLGFRLGVFTNWRRTEGGAGLNMAAPYGGYCQHKRLKNHYKPAKRGPKGPESKRLLNHLDLENLLLQKEKTIEDVPITVYQTCHTILFWLFWHAHPHLNPPAIYCGINLNKLVGKIIILLN